MDRRRVLKLIQASAVAATTWPLIRTQRAYAAPSSRPRFYLQIIPQGGMDAVFSTDPKTTKEVEAGIDVPYEANQIVEANGLRLGPGFRGLTRWIPRLAIVNAFRQNSANHLSGLANIMRCKSVSTPEMPSLLEILGARRHDEATGAVNVGSVMTSAFSPAFLGEPSTMVFGDRPGMFEYLDQADPDDLVALAKALRREAKALGGRRASTAANTTADNLLASAELFARVAVAPKFAPTEWAYAMEHDYHNGRDLQRALWLFEHRLTRCVTVCVGNQDYDTHIGNSKHQQPLAEYLAFLLDQLFTELEHRSVDGRPLAQQTLVIVGSEIGRFPRLNAGHGKDHFPQCPQLFYGPGVVGGACYGATDRSMAALPVSLANGRPERGGHLLRVDDIGTTLLALDGANPELYGYAGKHLEFLVA